MGLLIGIGSLLAAIVGLAAVRERRDRGDGDTHTPGSPPPQHVIPGQVNLTTRGDAGGAGA